MKPKRPNQNKPTPPLEQIKPHIERLWAACLTDIDIVAELQKVIDLNEYGIGLTKFVEIRRKLGLERTRRQDHTSDSIHPIMIKLRAKYPKAGLGDMISIIFHEHNMLVPRRVMREYFVRFEPHLVKQRKANRLRRRCFWAAGVNDIWAVDQHDKWLRFGLALHTGIEPFSGRLLWLKIWHSNRNPQLILSYYLETVEKFGFVPMITQSDPGTENFGIANAQTMLRQMHDPSLSGFVQHRWMRSKKNIMPEITWSQFRRRFAPGFEELLNEGIDEGWYNPHNTLQLMVFRWLFIPWLQRELDNYQFRINNTRKRRDKRKVLPHGIPELIYQCAADYDALDFKVPVSQDAINHVCNLYINPTHEVFDLLPAALEALVELCYNQLGRPPVERETVWGIYLELLELVHSCQDVGAVLVEIENGTTDSQPQVPPNNDDIALLQGLQDLYERTGYLGGIANGMGPDDDDIEPDIEEVNEIDACPSAWVDSFTSDEDDVDSEEEEEVEDIL